MFTAYELQELKEFDAAVDASPFTVQDMISSRRVEVLLTPYYTDTPEEWERRHATGYHFDEESGYMVRDTLEHSGRKRRIGKKRPGKGVSRGFSRGDVAEQNRRALQKARVKNEEVKIRFEETLLEIGAGACLDYLRRVGARFWGRGFSC